MANVNTDTAIQRVGGGALSLSASAMDFAEIQKQSDLINELLRNKMVEATQDNNYQGHFGIIPGTKQKSLMKPGAEMIAKMFRLGVQPEHKIEEMENGHINVVVTACVIHWPTNTIIGYGVGSCSTMESKHRYRTGPFEFTGKPVPQEFWTIRKNDPEAAQKLLGGRGFAAKKNPETGSYEIAIQGEKIENPDPADVWNTALKVATKRAYVAGIQTCTAAGDIFMVNAENKPPSGGNQNNGAQQNANPPQSNNQQTQQRPPQGQTQQQPSNGQAQGQQQGGQAIQNPDAPATEKQVKYLFVMMEQNHILEGDVKQYIKEAFGVDSTKALNRGQISSLIEMVKSGKFNDPDPGDDGLDPNAGY